jgi:hypothetical protein
MTLNQAIYSYLSGYSALTTLVSTRIHPQVVHEVESLPALVFERTDTERFHTMGATCSRIKSTWRFMALAGDYTAAHGVIRQVQAALANYAGTMGGAGGVVVDRVFLEGGIEDMPFEPGAEVFESDCQAVIWAVET